MATETTPLTSYGNKDNNDESKSIADGNEAINKTDTIDVSSIKRNVIKNDDTANDDIGNDGNVAKNNEANDDDGANNDDKDVKNDAAPGAEGNSNDGNDADVDDADQIHRVNDENHDLRFNLILPIGKKEKIQVISFETKNYVYTFRIEGSRKRIKTELKKNK